MTHMTISPMQHGYVTKKELSDLKSYINEGFDMTNKHIDNLEVHMNTKFTGIESKLTGLENKFTGLENRMDIRFAEQKEDITHLTKIVNKIAEKIL